MIDKDFWRGKRVFLTGHTGFKGSWISLWLNYLGAEVKGYSLDPVSSISLYDIFKIKDFINSEINDIRQKTLLAESINSFKPEIIIHMAAQPLVQDSYEFPIETYETNVMGTANILDAARKCNSVEAILCITTDKCYENNELDIGYKENDRMGGSDPYSSSKGCCELLINSFRKSFFEKENIGLASARAGNVIGGGDWSKNRLIPDILRSFQESEIAQIRNPESVRPWQHVLESLNGYLILLQNLTKNKKDFSGGWNFGPLDEDIKKVSEIANIMKENWEGADWIKSSASLNYESKLLKLNISKALTHLDWSPVWNIEDSIKRIISWHKAWMKKEDMKDFSLNEIKEFMKDAN